MKKVIRTILFALIILFASCEQPVSTITDVTTTDETTVTVDTNDDDVAVVPDTPSQPVSSFGDAIMAVINGDKLQLWDGTNLKTILEGDIEQAADKAWSLDNVLYYFDDDGNVINSEWLNITPDAIVTTKTPTKTRSLVNPGSTTVYSDSVVTLKVVSAEEAYSLGALYKPYTRVFVNGEEVSGNWYDPDNQWEVDYVVKSASGHLVAIATDTSMHNLTDDKEIHSIAEGGLMCYDWGNQHGFISDDTGYYEVTWSMSHISYEKWQKADGIWYTPNGYEWDNSVPEVRSNANCMYDINDANKWPAEYVDASVYPSHPWFFPAGVREENGEEVLYWLEAVTGDLYRFIPSIDKLEHIISLYEGYGTRYDTAQVRAKELAPLLIENKIYFQDLGSVKSYDLDTKMVSLFAGDVEVLGW